MRSIVRIQARIALRNAARGKCRTPCSAIRHSSSEVRQWSTPLAKQLSEAITATGPIPLASFMRMCLTSDVGGYYTSEQEGRDQFGRKGDFITSPEISQVFGELIGIWFVAEWMAQGKKDGVELVEIGPGRGTLMDDMLRTMQNFPAMAEAIKYVYMVEASPALREAQRKLLCGDAPMIKTPIGHKSMSKYNDIQVIWVENIRDVDSAMFNCQGEGNTPFIVAHEFFDALPIHAFQSIPAPPPPPESTSDTIQTPTGPIKLPSPSTETKRLQPVGPQWRELVVSPTPPPLTPSPKKKPDEFHLTLSHAPTPHSLYLPALSPRYKSLLNTPGSLVEISPESQTYISNIAKMIGGPNPKPPPKEKSTGKGKIKKREPRGAALILDYGPSHTIPLNSLRGIHHHTPVSPFSSPGLVDLSSDVDFTALAETALASSPGVEVHGPVEQASFLLSMGIKERAEMLVRGITKEAVVKGEVGSKDAEERKKGIEGAWRRLVDRGGSGMGKVYKVMAVVPESGGKRKPVGFGGDVE
ncbi:S-adenosyl-L-methionine-dependent methyltransferase [Amylocarpus encephaloides]|uniref:Protein arginine methyltransferase NDUFAF7 n=1 Tax=Amylocarpus encephaloides TaxID=45428 RepID=A0A9P7YE77_9HELO|nr:S-adenosyl-L-methionine-dependent methyltransferase [Amylocarpus encephaloides]